MVMASAFCLSLRDTNEKEAVPLLLSICQGQDLEAQEDRQLVSHSFVNAASCAETSVIQHDVQCSGRTRGRSPSPAWWAGEHWIRNSFREQRKDAMGQ